MRCHYPVNINGMSMPCNHCAACYKNHSDDWFSRLTIEFYNSRDAAFLTLDYAPEFVPINEQSGLLSLKKEDFQLFMKRLRQKVPAGTLRYFAVGEYGSQSHRPHYHAIMFGIDKYQCWEAARPSWRKMGKDIGHVHVGNVTPASIRYVCSYITARRHHQFNKTLAEPPFSLQSSNPGIGFQYMFNPEIIRYHKEDIERRFVQINGASLHMPKFYSSRIYNKTDNDILLERELPDKFAERYSSPDATDEQNRQSINSAKREFNRKYIERQIKMKQH